MAKKYMKTSILFFTFLFVLFQYVSAQSLQAPTAGDVQREIVETAQAYMDLLTEEQKEIGLMAFEDEERYNYNFIPMEREGLMLKDMTLEQRVAAHKLLRTALSNRGYLKVSGIMHLEDILYILEGEDRVFPRDPEMYYFSLFGVPSNIAPWGWRFEGHHLSLNFSSVTNELFSTTPAFLGSNPAEVRSGPYAGLRVLGAEEDLGRALVKSLDQEQLSMAIIFDRAPREIVTGTDRSAVLEQYEGLPASRMNETQKVMLMDIIEESANNLRREMAAVQLNQIREAGIDSLYFGWAGGLEKGDPHYYRVHGPTVLFEYDNVQNNANHVHTVWRDLLNDYSEDYLLRHYETAPEGHGHMQLHEEGIEHTHGEEQGHTHVH